MAAIGFIGASGLMGHGMAKNLIAKDHAVSLHGAPQPRRRRRLARRRREAVQLGRRARRQERDRLPLRHRLAAGRGVALPGRRACSPARKRGLVDRRLLDQRARLDGEAARDLRPASVDPRRRAARAHADRGRGGQAQLHGRRRRRDLRQARAGAARLRRERLPRRRGRAPATSSSCSTTSSARRSAPPPPKPSRSGNVPASTRRSWSTSSRWAPSTRESSR